MSNGLGRLSVVLAVVLAMIGACTASAPSTAETPSGSGSPSTSATAAASASVPGERVKVVYWGDTAGGGEGVEQFTKSVVAAFNAQSTTTEVEVVPQPNYKEAIKTALAAGQGPDIIKASVITAVDFVKAGLFLPLDDYAATYDWKARFQPWALRLGVIDGKLFSVPNETETLVLYYNKTLFDENGWTPPKTIADLRTLDEAIKAKGIFPFAHGKADWQGVNEWYVGEYLNHVAGPAKVKAALRGEAKWTDPEFVAAIDETTAQAAGGSWMGGLDRYFTATFAETDAAFADRTAAMTVSGTWFVGSANSAYEAIGTSDVWDWVPTPSSDGTPIFDLAIGSTWSINAHSQGTPRADAAAEFIDFIFSPAGQAEALKIAQAPAPIQLGDDALKGVEPHLAGILTELEVALAAGNYGYTTWTFFPPATATYLIDEIEKVWSGRITSLEYLQGMQEIFDKELAEGLVPPLP